MPENHPITIYVSSDLDVEVIPPSAVYRGGFVHIVENGGEGLVIIPAAEIQPLIRALSAAAQTLENWTRSQS